MAKKIFEIYAEKIYHNNNIFLLADEDTDAATLLEAAERYTDNIHCLSDPEFRLEVFHAHDIDGQIPLEWVDEELDDC